MAPLIIVTPGPASALTSAAPISRNKRRLDHLSWEEKMQRKKLKNRVAAQTSRDRKKAKMDDMESRLSYLEDTNAQLLDEMKSLRELNERLVGENDSLRKKLASKCEVDQADHLGSAESFPLPKEGSARSAPRLEAIYRLLILCLLSKNCSPKSIPKNISDVLNSLPTASCEKLMLKLNTLLQTRRKIASSRQTIRRKWWGPRQSTWNPMEVKS